MTGPLQAYASGALTHAWTQDPTQSLPHTGIETCPLPQVIWRELESRRSGLTNCVGRPGGWDRPIGLKTNIGPLPGKQRTPLIEAQVSVTHHLLLPELAD